MPTLIEQNLLKQMTGYIVNEKHFCITNVCGLFQNFFGGGVDVTKLFFTQPSYRDRLSQSIPPLSEQKNALWPCYMLTFQGLGPNTTALLNSYLKTNTKHQPLTIRSGMKLQILQYIYTLSNKETLLNSTRFTVFSLMKRIWRKDAG